MNKKRALIGAGGHAREVMRQMGIELPCFVEDEYLKPNTLPISQLNPDEYEVMIAVGDSKNRKKIKDKLHHDLKFFTFIHPTALIMDSNIEIGEGTFIGAYSILTTNIKIGNHSLLNRGNHIGHDSVCGDFLSMMPGSIISGNVDIGNLVYIGTNSSVRERCKIGDNIKVGLNSGVIKDINKEGTYVGTPAKLIS